MILLLLIFSLILTAETGNTSDLGIVNPINQYLELVLTNKWSDDPTVNFYLLNKAVRNDEEGTFGFNAVATSNKNLWALSSEIVNKTFEFYERKTKSKEKLKQLMELKSIGLLSNDKWLELGFNSYGNNDKSEIEVDDLIDLYDNFYTNNLDALVNANSKKIFKDSKINTIFLAKLLERLNLKMINGKVFEKYDADFIKKLLEVDNIDTFNNYKKRLLSDKVKIINSLSVTNQEYLPLFIKLQTLNKMIEVLKTNGFTKTIPEFKKWLEYQKNDGIYSEYYSQFSDEYLGLINNILNNPEEEYISPIRGELTESYFELLGKIDNDANYNELNEIYSKLENIEIITSERDDVKTYPIDEMLEVSKKLETITTLKELTPLDFQYLVFTKENLFYNNDNTNLYYLYNSYKENNYSLPPTNSLEALIGNNIIMISNSRNLDYDILKNIKIYADFSYYLSDTLISLHHSKYEMVASIIRNISFSEEQGVDYSEWVIAANNENIEGSDIWEVLGINKSSMLSESAPKDLNISIIMENYSKLTNAVKKSLGLAVDILDDGYDISSMFFDPITTMLLSKIFVDKGYHISTDENGNDAIFNSDNIKVELAMEIDKLIGDIKDKNNLFLGEFGNLFNSDSLDSFLNEIRAGNNSDLTEMMKFINFSYSIDPKTGERSISIDFGVSTINDKILWNNITGGMGNVSNASMGFWEAYALGKAVDGGYEYAKGYLTNMYNDFHGEFLLALESHKAQIEFQREMDRKIRRYGADEAIALGRQRVEDENTKLKRLRTKANKLEDTITGYERSIDDYATKSNSSQNEYEKEYNNQMIRQYKDLHAKANKEADDNEFQIRKQKAILKSAEEELLKEVAYIKNQPKPNEMCRPEEYNPDCDGGVGPSGDPRLILSQKGALGQKLIELASQKIANIPIKECNVITKACNGNSVEVTAEELQMMMDSIANEAMEDDGACDWTPLNGCSFFDSNGQSKWYYMNLLWDPTPDFNSIIEYLPTK